MIDFSDRHLFTPFIHPESGGTFHILTRKVAPVQQGFYFVKLARREQEDILRRATDAVGEVTKASI